MNVSTNASQLVRQVLAGEVWPALADRHAYRVGPDGQPFVLPGMGGVTLGVHCGDPATGYASDHLEPGASVRHRDPGANMALQFLTCVGNEVRVASGPAAGALGHVIGQHAYVLVDFPEAAAAELTVGDAVTVVARGQGLALPDHPEITVKNCDPALIERMPGGTRPDGRLEVHVAARVPAEAIGAGSGMISEYANTDLMGAYAGLGEDLSLGLEGLRVGDIVALADADHRYGRGYQAGYLTIGVMSTGQCMLFGHGPGPSTLLSGPAGAFHVVDDPDANLASWFHPHPQDTGHYATSSGGIPVTGGAGATGPDANVPPGTAVTTEGTAAGVRTALRPVAVNLLGVIEHPVLDGGPWRIGRNGTPYVPLGDGGIVLDLQLGDSVFGLAGDHAAPGACLTHPDAAARHALSVYACIGNTARVRTGQAAGARGVVIGKRGEEGRVIVGFGQADLARMRPSDHVAVRGFGQGMRPPALRPDVTLMNTDPDVLALLPVTAPDGGDAPVTASVRMTVPSRLAGNGIGRPAAGWDLDLQLPPPGPDGAGDLRLGDLVAVTDVDARWNMGYRRDWVTVGVVVHGTSPLPGHGPGITPILTGPAGALQPRPDPAGHVGLTPAMLKL